MSLYSAFPAWCLYQQRSQLSTTNYTNTHTTHKTSKEKKVLETVFGKIHLGISLFEYRQKQQYGINIPQIRSKFKMFSVDYYRSLPFCSLLCDTRTSSFWLIVELQHKIQIAITIFNCATCDYTRLSECNNCQGFLSFRSHAFVRWRQILYLTS